MLATLGRTPCSRSAPLPLAVTRRQLELLTVLSLHPEGLNLDELAGKVYGDQPVSPSTVKAELSHLRHALGGRIGSRPYRLLGRVESDHGAVLEALVAGDLVAAVAAYGGTLPAVSASPEIEALRHHLEVALRDAVLASGDGTLLRALSQRCWDDVELQRAAVASIVGTWAADHGGRGPHAP